METNKTWLKTHIEKFVEVIKECITNTTFKKDIEFYERDLLFVNSWLNDLEIENSNYMEVVTKILEPQTSKILTDYWRNGEWGDKQNQTFLDFKKEIRNKFTD